MIHKITILGPATVSFDDETKHFTVSNITAPEVITSGGLVQPTPSAFPFATDGPDNPLPAERSSPYVVNGSTAPKPQIPDNPGWYVGVAKLTGWKPGELAELRMTYGADYYKVTEDGRAWCYVFGLDQEGRANALSSTLSDKYYVSMRQTPFPRVDPNNPTPMPPDDLFGITPQVCDAFNIDPRSALRVEWPPLTAVKNQHPDA